MITACHRPPRLTAIPMYAVGSHSGSRLQCVVQKLILKGVINEAGNARRKSPVALIFHLARMLFPVLAARRKCLCGYQRLTVYVANRSGFCHAVSGVKAEALAPKFPHRHVRYGA